jgi:trehalose synthase
MNRIQDYNEITGDALIHNIYAKTRKLYNKHIAHINSTSMGGGVAEILISLIPLLNDIGINTGWRILHGNPDFFTITKKFHNALQGDTLHLTQMKKDLYLQTNQNFSVFTHLKHDCVFIHDPQPLPLLNFYRKRQPWIWRCHIDLSNPNPELWNFLKRYILKYDLVIVSHENYKKEDLPVEQRVIHPAIDPLTAKNKKLSEKDILKYLKKFNIPLDKPLITQISRFDKWKDPDGVIEIFKRVRAEVDCRLILCGSMASDDPEGMQIYNKVRQKANNLIEEGSMILVTVENNVLVNAIQTVSSVIIQKSIREGFGLTVAEALWKGTPVVASNKGGIPLQVRDSENGFLLDPTDTKGFADRIIYLLKHPDEAEEFGRRGHEHVKKNFLVTRLVFDHLNLLNEIL